MENAVLELLELAEFLEQEKAKWVGGPSSSDGGPHVDEDVNAALVKLILQLAEVQDVALGWLNEQTMSIGETQSAWKATLDDALNAVHAARSDGTATVLPIGEVDEDPGDALELGGADIDASPLPPPQRARRPALSAVETELRLIAGLSLDAATQRRELDMVGLVTVTAQPTIRAIATTVVQAMGFLLLKAMVIGGVASTLVGALWWAVGEGVAAEARHMRAACALAGLFAIGSFFAGVGMLISVTRSRSRGTALRALSLAVPAMLPLAVWAAFFQLGGAAQSVSAYAFTSTLVLAYLVAALLVSVHVGATMRAVPINEASRRARAALHGIANFSSPGAEPVLAWSWRKAALGTVNTALPALFVIAIGAVYIFGVFAAYRKATESWLKTIVFTIALGIKIVGNKGQLELLQRMPHLPPAVADQFSFLYEFTTALLSRVLVLSIPDIGTAQLLSMANSVVEVKVRSHSS
jgi:hypothetical protein